MSTIAVPVTGRAPWRPDLEIDLAVDRPADLLAIVIAAVAAVATDVVLHSEAVGLTWTIFFAAAAIGCMASRRLVNPQAQALAAAVLLFAPWLTIRSSPWLVAPDVLVCLGLLALAASYGSGGSVLDLTVPDILGRAAMAVLHGVAAPAFALSAVPRREGNLGRWGRVLRGVALAVPVVVVLAALLASADPVFASLFDVATSVPTLVQHLVLLGLGFWGMAALLRLASARAATVPSPWPRPTLGRTEATIVLGALVALFAVFTTVQAVAAAGGGRKVITTRGLTYAEYARSGFFQLLVVAALTLLVLMAVRGAAAQRGTLPLPLHVLSQLAVALTLVIVALAVRRLRLYEQAYGLTMLRLYSFVAASWIAGTFLLLAAAMAGVVRHRQWFVPGATALALALLLVLNVADPEAFVVRHNALRFTAG